MTKRVRIENADTAAYKVDAFIFDLREQGAALVDVQTMANPAEQREILLWSDRIVVVAEQGTQLPILSPGQIPLSKAALAAALAEYHVAGPDALADPTGFLWGLLAGVPHG